MAALFWVGGSAAYDGTTNRFATTSGGTATVAAVTSADTVTFDNLSPAAAVVTTSAAISCSTLTLNTGFTGSLTMSNTLTVSGAATVVQGSLFTNGQTCSWASMTATGALTRTLDITNSTINVSGTGTVWAQVIGGLTFTATGSTVNFTNVSATAKTVTFNSVTINNVSFAASVGAYSWAGGQTIVGTVTFNAPTSVILNSSATKTLSGSGNFVFAGTSPGKLITFTSTTPGTQYTLSSANSVTARYISLTDCAATGGGTFTAYESISGGHNSGWQIVGGPSGMNNQQFIKVGDGMSASERIR